MASARHFDVRRQPGFALVAMFTFALLYLPMVVLVVFAFNAERFRRRLDRPVAALVPGRGRQCERPGRRPALAGHRGGGVFGGDRRRYDGGAGHHPHAALSRLDLQIRLHQPAADGARDRHRGGAADRLFARQGMERLFRPGLPDRRPLGLLHPLRLSADQGAAGKHGSHPRARRRRPLRDALDGVPPGNAAAAEARHHRRLHAGLRHLAGRRRHHRIRQVGRPGHAPDLHAGAAAARRDAGGQRHRHRLPRAVGGHRHGVFPAQPPRI